MTRTLSRRINLTIVAVLCVIGLIVGTSIKSSREKKALEEQTYTSNENKSIVVLDEQYYISEMRGIAVACKYDVECMESEFRKRIPSKYEISARIIQVNGRQAWQYTCSDTSNKWSK